MSFTIEYMEYALLVLIRIASIFVIAPFFSQTTIPRKVKVGLAFFLAIIVFHTVDYTAVSYDGVLGYSILVMKEAITGLLIGFGSGVCIYILNFSGHMIDMEIGFSMAMEFDPATNVQSTVSSSLFGMFFMAMFFVCDMHYFVIDALFDSYQMIPIGGANFQGNLLEIALRYITDYFVIGFRIILPIFACILVINVVLGILAKVAPQMNMFVVGMQIKVFVGLFLLFILMSLLPGIADFIYKEMQEITNLFMNALAS